MDRSINSQGETSHGHNVPLGVALGMMLAAAVVALAGAALGYFTAISMLNKATPLSAVAQPASQIDLVAPTAQALASDTLPDATTADTLKDARSYLRAGPADAKVQIVLFEDAQCPYCKQFSTGPVKQVLNDYLPTNAVAVTFRHYAFLNDDSTKMALAMECAGKQDRFWPYHDLVFGDAPAATGGEQVDARLARWAVSVKLDADVFAACMANPATRALVASDLNAGRALLVQGTPTIFVNGKRLVGNLPYDYLKSAIDEALRNAQ
jgi:protein-disulfide isomerase